MNNGKRKHIDIKLKWLISLCGAMINVLSTIKQKTKEQRILNKYVYIIKAAVLLHILKTLIIR